MTLQKKNSNQSLRWIGSNFLSDAGLFHKKNQIDFTFKNLLYPFINLNRGLLKSSIKAQKNRPYAVWVKVNW